LASWYGREFHGKRTASGEVFDMNAMTAAHPTLPFDTRVRVTNLENRRSVVLRINDRGPNVRGRIIDVSLAAARKLDFEQQGLAQVKVEVN
ncbi:MAG TPA: septal ring lytic transglycosylase RlpA family protein, partial [bacterium]|nr:septal ring lytic transglycosylase RlpA family protein [bacterium]